MQHAIKLFLLLVLLIPTLAFSQNRPPVVNAGPDQHIFTIYATTNKSTVLTGTATDPDNDSIVAWQWAVESAPAGSTWFLGIPQRSQTEFYAYDVGDYVISLVASDGIAWSLPDYVTIYVTEQEWPVAVATADVTEGKAPLTVQLDGSQSTVAPYSEPLLYAWNFGDQTVTSYEVSPSHTYSSPGTYTAGLTVIDDVGLSDHDAIQIRVTAGCLLVDPDRWWFFGYPPVGSSNPLTVYIRNVCTSTPVTVSSVSLTPDSYPDYAVTEAPAFPVTLAPGDTALVEVTFTPSTPYYTEASLVITSDDATTPVISLHLGNSANRPPIVDAGPDQDVFTNDNAVLTGTATDPDNDSIVAWQWTVESAPEGSNPLISEPQLPDTAFIADLPGDYVLSLAAWDGLAWSWPDYVTIHVADPQTTGNNFTVLDHNGNIAFGTNDVAFQWKGGLNAAVSSAAVNASISFDEKIAGGVTTIHHVMLYEPGTYTVYTDCTAGAPGCGAGTALTFSVGPQQVGGHMLLDATAPFGVTDLDLVMVWNLGQAFLPSALYQGPDDGVSCSPSTVCDGAQNPPDHVWSLMSSDNDGDGINGLPVFESNIPGHSMNFNLVLPDYDSDGLSNYYESVLGSGLHVTDSDGDGLEDGDEVYTHSTSPTLRDSDGDGFGDGVEVLAGTNPNNPSGPWPAADGDLAPLNVYDGMVNAGDVLVAERMTLGLVPQDALAIAHGDLATGGNSAGVIDTADLLLILQQALNGP